MDETAKHPVLLLSTKHESSKPLEDQELGTSEQHSNLKKSILNLSKKDKRKSNASQRTEFAPKVSEFHLKAGESGHVKVDIRDLARPLTKDKDTDDSTLVKPASNAKGTKIHKEVRSLKACAPTRAPLVKHEEERLLRQVGYDVAYEDVKKWKGVVKRNRDAETTSFPLVQPSFNVNSTQELVKRFKPRTPLELEVAKLLKGSESVLGQERILTVREEKALKAMDVEEAKRKRAELQKMRSLQSFAQTRAKRQGKIKSKRFHRRLRKEKEAEKTKMAEEIEKSFPERFQEMMENVERKRVKERMNQRHKNNSRWVKSMMKLGKKDSEARTALNEALETSRKLTEKQKVVSDEEEEEEPEVPSPNQKNGETGDHSINFTSNPWLSANVVSQKDSLDDHQDEEETISSLYPKLEEIRNEVESDEDGNSGDDEDADSDEDHVKDDDRIETVQDEEEALEKAEAMTNRKPPVPVKDVSGSKSDEDCSVDPTKIMSSMKSPSVMQTIQLPTLSSYEDEDHRLTIQEAFADDDVVAEFAALKNSVIDAEKPKDVCLALPGWGDWVGGDLSGVSSKRKRKFTVKPEQASERRDRKMPRVIINEKPESKMALHQVSDLPTRDFDSVEQFEKSIRAPVGRTWNAEGSYQKMIVPNVTTKMGTVIDPINKERTFLRKEVEEEEEKKEESKNKTRRSNNNTGKKRRRKQQK